MISQRISRVPWAEDGLSDDDDAPRESGWAGAPEKFMSAILTYLGFNVTKLPVATKF
jgi:hypothetical protein